MKKMISILLMIALLIPSCALADNVQLQLMDGIAVDAPAPVMIAEAPAQVKVEYLSFDPEVAKALLMPGDHVMEKHANEDGTFDTTYGVGDGPSEYMLVNMGYGLGRVFYGSAFYSQRIQNVIRHDDEMVDSLQYYPQDREVEGFPRADAKAQVDALLGGLQISDCVIDERIYTFDTLSYEVMLQELRVSDRQAQIPRIYLEDYDSAHDGYLFTYSPAIGGLPIVGSFNEKLAIFISRQGIEYLETDYPMRAISEADSVPVMDAMAALQVAKPQIEEKIKRGREYVIGEALDGQSNPALIERIRFGYTFKLKDGASYDDDFDYSTAYPAWEYTYQRAMWKDEGDWRTRSFDNNAFIGRLILDGATGDYIVSEQR